MPPKQFSFHFLGTGKSLYGDSPLGLMSDLDSPHWLREVE